MNRRPPFAPVVLGLAAALTLAACSSPSGSPEEPPQPDMPGESTPAPDATEGIEPGLEDFYTQTLTWDDCGDQYQCSTLTVPLDYDDPDGDEIELALLRAPATGADRAGSLVVNPGGPGASGVSYARNAHVVASDAIRERYDIVGFDPRGVGESTPVDCLDDADLDDYVSDAITAETPEGAAELESNADAFAAACDARSGELLPHVGTDDVARDVDVLRAALGDSRLSYLGKSYGTFIGAVYADLFPERSGHLVLDGALDPALESEEVALGQAQGFEESLDAYIRWCLENDCPIGSDEAEARQAVTDLLAETDETPLPTNDEARPLTTSLAFYGIVLPLYLSADEGYPVLSSALDLAVNDGDGSVLLQLADLYLARNPDGTYDGNQNEAIVAVNCADRPTTEEDPDPADLEAELSRFEDVSPTFGRLMAGGGFTCAPWPTQSDYDRASLSGEGADPVLVVGTTGDPATPYAWAEALADQLESGTLLTYDAFVHTAYLSGSSCIDEAVDAYLLDGTVPDEGLVCS